MSFTVYPNAIDGSDQLPVVTDNVTPVKAEVVNRYRDAIIAIESELGIEPSGTYTTVRARLDALEGLIGQIGTDSGKIAAVLDEGSIVRTNVSRLNFKGSAVTATASGTAGQVDITITGTGGGGGTIVQEQETIAVTILGQTIFVLTQSPADATAVQMYVNGQKQEYGSDYTALGTTITYAGSLTLQTTDIVEFWYIVSGGGGGGGGGGEDLATTLTLGNATGGTDIILNGGSNINAAGSTITLDDDTDVNGNLEVTGKLTVTGLIDPTGMVFDEQATVPGGAPGAAKGTIWVRNDAPNVLIFTDDSGTDNELAFVSAFSPTLANVLSNGSITGGTDITLTSGDEVVAAAGSGSNGADAVLRGGAASGAFQGGDASVIGGSAASGTAGQVSITGGLSVSGTGGDVVITSGFGTSTAGAISFVDGNAGTHASFPAADAGHFQFDSAVTARITQEQSSGTSNGGDLTVTAQQGGSGGGARAGGDLLLNGGNGVSGGDGGDIQLTAGSGASSGAILLNNDTTISGKLTVTGLIDPTGMVFDEQATVPGGAPGSAKGTIWVRNDSPNVLMFTDDAGTDFEIIQQSANQEISFSLVGVFSGAAVPGTFESPYHMLSARTISSVSLIRRVAGDSGTTRVDVLKNGVSIFANDAVKPQVTSASGDESISTKNTFTSSSFSINDILDIELETAETGGAQDLRVIVRFS